MYRYANENRTTLIRDNPDGGTTTVTLANPDDFNSVGDGLERECLVAWLANGNTPDPYVPPTPSVLPSKDARLDGMLKAHGLTLADLKAAIGR